MRRKKGRVRGKKRSLILLVLCKLSVRCSFMVHMISDLRRAHHKLVKAEPTFPSLFKFHVGDIWQESFYFRSGAVLRAD